MSVEPVPAQMITTLDAALGYAELGIRVVPIIPGKKHPPMGAWGDAATTDPELITNWWSNLYRDHGVGLVTGPGSGIWTLDVDREDALQELIDAYGADPLPDTACLRTGGGGLHYLFRWDPNRPVPSTQRNPLLPDIDLRGTGGQSVAPPTIHPSGRRYTWIRHPSEGIADAPDWLYQLIAAATRTEQPPPAPSAPLNRTSWDDKPSPADRAHLVWNYDELLTQDGWTRMRGDKWCRPGKNPRDGHSAVLHDNPWGPFVIFTSQIPAPLVGKGKNAGTQGFTYSLFDYVTATRFAGNPSATSRHILDQLDGPRTPDLLTGAIATPVITVNQPDTDPRGPAAPQPLLPNLPNEFWETTDTLKQIREYAHNCGAGADAVLAATLARVSAATPHTIVVKPNNKPPISLNYIVALIGPSGAGKSIAVTVATDTITSKLIQLDNVPPSSGEGLVEAYMGTTTETRLVNGEPKNRTVRAQTKHNALWYADEGEEFLTKAGRDGSTTLSTLRSLWSGSDAGSLNATAERTRHIGAHNYRFALIAGFQLGKADTILNDTAGGTPQRFLWVNVTDPNIPLEPQPTEPHQWDPLDNTLTRFPNQINWRHRNFGIIGFPKDIGQQLFEQTIRATRGEIIVDPDESQRPVLAVKTAALLALLHNQTDTTHQHWELANTILDTSNQIRQTLNADRLRRQAETEQRKATQQGATQIITQRMLNQEEDANVERVALLIARKVWRQHEPCTTRDLNAAAGRRSNRKYIQDGTAIDHAIDAGWIVPNGDKWERGPQDPATSVNA